MSAVEEAWNEPAMERHNGGRNRDFMVVVLSKSKELHWMEVLDYNGLHSTNSSRMMVVAAKPAFRLSFMRWTNP